MKQTYDKLNEIVKRLVEFGNGEGILSDIILDLRDIANPSTSEHPVIFEAWSVADLRERIEDDGGEYPTLASMSDDEFYSLLEHIQRKDMSFYDNINGLDLVTLEELAQEYNK